MEEPAADELVRVEVEDADFPCVATCPLEADVSTGIVAEEAFLAEGAFLYVAREVAEGCFACAYWLELDVPWLGIAEAGSGFGTEF